MIHEQTRIYAKARELNQLVVRKIDTFPDGMSFLANQLKRASSSIMLNFAEGCAKSTPRDRARYFKDARGSAGEVAAGLDVACDHRLLDAASYERGKELCDQLGGMLFRFR